MTKQKTKPKSPYFEKLSDFQVFRNTILGTSIIILSTLLVLCFVVPEKEMRWIAVFVAFSLFSSALLVLNKRGYTKIASLLFIYTSFTIVYLLALTAGGMRAHALAFLPVLVLLAGILLGWKDGIISGLVVIIGGLGLVFLDRLGMVSTTQIPFSPLALWINLAMNTILLILLQFIAVARYKNADFESQQEALLRKKAEAELEESKVFRERIFESSRIAIVIMDSDTGKFIDCNEAACEIYHFKSREDTIGKTPLDVSAPIQYDGLSSLEKLKSLLDKGRNEVPIVFEWKHKRPNGEFWDAEVHMMGFEVEKRKLLQFTLLDITERRIAEKALRESEERYRKLIEASPDIIMLSDLAGNILYGNGPLEDILGISPKDYNNPGRAPGIYPDDLQIVTDAIQDLLLHEKSHTDTIENRYIDSNGVVHWLSGRIAKLTVNGQVVLQTVSRDITQKKKIEKELEAYRSRLEFLVQERTEELAAANKELNESNEELHIQKEELITTLSNLNSTQKQLVHSEKMASIGILTAGLAHEINNPLNFIHGGVLALGNYFRNNLPLHMDRVNPLLNAINVGVRRAAEIVTSMGQYSIRIQEPFVECDIHGILDDSLFLLHEQVDDKIEIKKNYTGSRFVLAGNKSKLQQAFVNIITNAEQSIRERGSISISTQINNLSLIIIIKDTGCGIKKEDLPKIFDPFYTTKDPGQGAGLGLSLVYKIIKEHTGIIEIDSEIDVGTKVFISLPITK